MKNISLLLVFSLFVSFVSCGEKETKKEEKSIKLEKKVEKPAVAKTDTSKDDLIALGEKLFTEKTCVTCHQKDKKIIGPSIIDINKVYAEKNADIVAFLKGELKPIVDTDPGQVAIMKANLDGFVKDLKDRELNAIKAYMQSIK